MSKFHVGQRVVIVKTKRFPDLLGLVTTVLASATWPRRGLAYEIDVPERDSRIAVKFPNMWSSPDAIEPLPDDGHERGEWTDELLKLCKAGRVEA